MNKQNLASDISDIETFLAMARECILSGDNKGADNLLRLVVRESKKVIFNISSKNKG